MSVRWAQLGESSGLGKAVGPAPGKGSWGLLVIHGQSSIVDLELQIGELLDAEEFWCSGLPANALRPCLFAHRFQHRALLGRIHHVVNEIREQGPDKPMPVHCSKERVSSCTAHFSVVLTQALHCN